MKTNWIRWVFALSALYDGLLGLLFLLVPNRVFAARSIPPPNHMGYVQFPALLLILFACLFVQIAANPLRRRDWIPYGMGLKAAYCAVVFYHHVLDSIPNLWVPFAYIDLVFLFFFALAWWQTKPQPAG